MVPVYSDADYLAAYKQKQKIWWVFVAVTACYLALSVGLLVYHISLPYAAPLGWLPQWTVYITSAVYALLIFPYMAIKFSRSRRYVKMLSYVSAGLKQEEQNYFYCFDEQPLPKDNVDVLSCVFATWNNKKREWREREVYFDPEKPLPPFECGDLVRYTLQGKFIVQYEILQKRALEFEEVEEQFEGRPSPQKTEKEEERIEETTQA